MDTDLLNRLKSYIAKMEPHQKEHPRGRLLIEAYEALKDMATVNGAQRPSATSTTVNSPVDVSSPA